MSPRATLRGGAASHDGCVVPSSGADLCKGMKQPSSHNEWAVPSLVSCGSPRVLALYDHVAEVVVVVGVAVGAVAGVARSVGWGLCWGSSCGSSCGVTSSLALLAES